MKRHNCDTLDDFYAAIGYGGIILSRMMQRLKEDYTKEYVEAEQLPVSPVNQPANKSSDGIIVEGIDNCLIKFSQCCNPLPGDDVIGFITRGHGVSVHKKDCVNYVNAIKNEQEPERWINVYWASSRSKTYRATLDIVSYDRNGLLADVAIVLSEMRIFIHESSSRQLKNGNANIVLTISIAGIEQLNNIIARLKKINGVISVDRSGK